jgi:hypothetical protein
MTGKKARQTGRMRSIGFRQITISRAMDTVISNRNSTGIDKAMGHHHLNVHYMTDQRCEV